MALDLNSDFLPSEISTSLCGFPMERNSFVRRLRLTPIARQLTEAKSSCAHSGCETSAFTTRTHVGCESSSVNSSLFEKSENCSQLSSSPAISRCSLANSNSYATLNPMGEAELLVTSDSDKISRVTQSRTFRRQRPHSETHQMCQSDSETDHQAQLPYMQLSSDQSDLTDVSKLQNLLTFALTVITHLCHSPAVSSTTEVRRRQSYSPSAFRWSSGLIYTLLVLLSPMVLRVADGCSTRPSPKPRPPRPQWVPDISVERENCTADYAALFCLNDGVCFRTKVLDTFIVSCECQEGWYGRRCEYKDTPDRFLGVQQRRRIETASLAGGLTILIVIICCVSVGIYVYYRRRKFPRDIHASEIDRIRPFSVKRRENSLAVRSHLCAEDRPALSPPLQISDLSSVVISPMRAPRINHESFYDNQSHSDSPEHLHSHQNITFV